MIKNLTSGIFFISISVFFANSHYALADSSILIEAISGGKNPLAFCEPVLKITNNSSNDIGGMLVQLEWKEKSSGNILQAVGTHGTLVENFASGDIKKPFVSGFVVDCNNLELSIGTYACRDSNAVRKPCPAPLIAKGIGGIHIYDVEIKEGKMKGVVEP
jgi:hypothetical protein